MTRRSNLEIELKRINTLLALLGVQEAIKSEEKYIKEYKKLFTIYTDELLKAIKKSKLLDILYDDAVNFIQENSELVKENIFENILNEKARREGSVILDPILKPLIDAINNLSDHKELAFKNIKEGYDLGAVNSIMSVIIQNEAYRQNLKKNLDWDDVIDELDLNNELADNVGKIKIKWKLRDSKVLRALEERAAEIDWVTNLDFNRISDIIIEELYINGNGPETVARRLREEFNSISDIRSRLIARTEVNIAQNKAIVEQGRRIGIEWKEWLSMQDAKVRPQHTYNDAGGPVPFNQPFMGGDSEYSPDDCASPYNCRCVLLLVGKPESLDGLYWDGMDLVDF